MITTNSGKTTTIKDLINDYIKGLSVEDWVLENFNEASFQLNLGRYIDEQLNNGVSKTNNMHPKKKNYRIQFERNIEYFTFKNTLNNPLKKEADIVIIEEPSSIDVARKSKIIAIIEIKFFRKYPQAFSSSQKNVLKSPTTHNVYKTLQDIAFLKQIRSVPECYDTELYQIFLTDYEFNDNLCATKEMFIGGYQPTYMGDLNKSFSTRSEWSDVRELLFDKNNNALISDLTNGICVIKSNMVIEDHKIVDLKYRLTEIIKFF